MTMNQFKNGSLFDYALKEVYSHGGDGDVAVLFKQQNPDDVTVEFELYLKSIGEELKWRRGGTNMFYSTVDQDCIAFSKATDVEDGPYRAAVLSRTQLELKWPWMRWDTTIITW